MVVFPLFLLDFDLGISLSIVFGFGFSLVEFSSDFKGFLSSKVSLFVGFLLFVFFWCLMSESFFLERFKFGLIGALGR